MTQKLELVMPKSRIDGQYTYDMPEDCIVWKDFAGGILKKYFEMDGKSDIDSLIDVR